MRQDAQKPAPKFCVQKRSKKKKRTRKSPKRAKPGAFWVLEGMGRLGENGKRVFTFSTDLSRLPARSACGTRFWSGCGRV